MQWAGHCHSMETLVLGQPSYLPAPSRHAHETVGHAAMAKASHLTTVKAAHLRDDVFLQSVLVQGSRRQVQAQDHEGHFVNDVLELALRIGLGCLAGARQGRDLQFALPAACTPSTLLSPHPPSKAWWA